MNDMKITPQANQIEINPWNQRQADLAWHERYQVQAEAWAPFAEGRHELFTNPAFRLKKTAQNVPITNADNG